MFYERLKGLSSTEKKTLAASLDITTRAIDHWITGRNKPNPEHIPGLATYFHLDVKGLTLEVYSKELHEGYSITDEVEIEAKREVFSDKLVQYFPHIPRFIKAINEGAEMENYDMIVQTMELCVQYVKETAKSIKKKRNVSIV